MLTNRIPFLPSALLNFAQIFLVLNILGLLSSVNRSQIYFFIIRLSQQKTLAQKHTKFAKVLSKLCQILKNHLKCCKISLNVGQNGEILPNLVTLVYISLNLFYLYLSISFSLFFPLHPSSEAISVINLVAYLVFAQWATVRFSGDDSAFI